MKKNHSMQFKFALPMRSEALQKILERNGLEGVEISGDVRKDGTLKTIRWSQEVCTPQCLKKFLEREYVGKDFYVNSGAVIAPEIFPEKSFQKKERQIMSVQQPKAKNVVTEDGKKVAVADQDFAAVDEAATDFANDLKNFLGNSFGGVSSQLKAFKEEIDQRLQARDNSSSKEFSDINSRLGDLSDQIIKVSGDLETKIELNRKAQADEFSKLQAEFVKIKSLANGDEIKRMTEKFQKAMQAFAENLK